MQLCLEYYQNQFNKLIPTKRVYDNYLYQYTLFFLQSITEKEFVKDDTYHKLQTSHRLNRKSGLQFVVLGLC